MSKITILDTDYATLWYHPETKIVQHVFHRFIYGPRFREVLETGLQIFKEHGAQKWLSDDRKNSTLTADDTKWALNDWNPRVYAAGWKYWAIVMPDKVVGQLNMERIMKDNIALGLTIKVFEDADEALKWLEEA